MSLPRLLPSLALLIFASSLLSAPAPVKQEGLPPLERYLLDDTDCVTVVNVKQIVAAPMFAKNFKKKLETWLVSEAVAPYLKGTGIDLFADVDRIVMVLGRSCYGDKPNAGDGPVLLVQGRFNPSLLHGKMKQLAKDMPKVVTIHDEKAMVYQITGNSGAGNKSFAVILDRSTVMLAGSKEHVLAAQAKAAGTKRTVFTNKKVPVALKALKPDLAVQAFGLEETIFGSSHTMQGNGGLVAKHNTLDDSGFKSFAVRVAVKDDVRGTIELAGKNKDVFEKKAQEITTGFDFVKQLLKQQAEQKAEMAPLVRAIDSVKVKKGNDTLTFEGVIDAAAVQALIDATGMRAGKQ